MENKSNKVLTIFVVCFYLFALGSFGIRARWVFAITLVTVSFVAMANIENLFIKISDYKKLWCFIYCVITILIFLPTSRHETDIYNYFMYVTITTYVVIMVRTNDNEIRDVKKLMIYMGLFFAFYISFFRIFPGIYRVTVYKFLAESVKETYSMNAKFGYGLAIGNGYTFSDTAICLGIVSLISTDLVEGEKKVKNKVCLMIMFLGMLLEGRKSELLAAIVMTCYLYNFGWTGDLKILKKRMLYLIGIGLVGVFILVLFNNNGLLQRFVILFDRLKQVREGSNTDYTSGRFVLWNNAFNLFKKYPVIGAGWGRFANYTHGVYQEVADKAVQDTVRDTHNVLLQLLCETGMIGTFLIVAPIIRIFRITLKEAHFSKKQMYQYDCTGKSLLALGMMVYSIILSFMDPNFYNPYFWWMFAISIVIQDYGRRKHIIFDLQNKVD